MAKNKKGFTLIEILITVTVIALVALIGIGGYLSSGRSLNFAKSVEETENLLISARTSAKSGKNYYKTEEVEHFILEIRANNIKFYTESTGEFNYQLDDPENPQLYEDYLIKELDSGNLNNASIKAYSSQGNFLKPPVLFVFDYQTAELETYFSFNGVSTLLNKKQNDFVIIEISDVATDKKQYLIVFQHSGQINKLSAEDYAALTAGPE